MQAKLVIALAQEQFDLLDRAVVNALGHAQAGDRGRGELTTVIAGFARIVHPQQIHAGTAIDADQPVHFADQTCLVADMEEIIVGTALQLDGAGGGANNKAICPSLAIDLKQAVAVGNDEGVITSTG